MSTPEGIEDLRGLPLLAAVVAHEIRNPLSAVKIALQTVERQNTLPTNDATRLRIALREVATIERVLTQVLEWARPPELHQRECTPSDLVDSAVALVKREASDKQIQFAQRIPSAPTVQADPERLPQALAELLRNAIDASPRQGTITITVVSQGHQQAVMIENAGAALSSEDAQRAFDPFFTRKARGIGLGLPRARQVALGHGGEVTLEPRADGGALATLKFST